MRNRLPELLPHSGAFITDIVIEPTLKDAAHALLARIGFAGKKLLLVSDTATHAALGARLAEELAALEMATLVFKESPHADEAALNRIRMQNFDALIAVGAGTISDLCKYASHLAGKPYAVFPTAPSMNGYCSANASIMLAGVKETRLAHLPEGIFCDVSVLAAAPNRLIQSGLGDSLCRPTAQADWLLSHLLLETDYSPLPFDLLMPYEAELFAHADKLIRGDIMIIALLLKTLLVSGLGMTLSGGSYPASQGEHLIAHTLEMKYGDTLPETYHGEQIGVTTLTMAKLQEERLSHPLTLPPKPHWEESLVSYFGSAKGHALAATSGRKYALYDRFDAIGTRLAGQEKEFRERIKAVTRPEAELRAVLAKADARTEPAHLGISEHDYEIAASRARFIRDRFTFLDML